MAKWGEGDPRWIVEERPDATNVNNWHWTEKNATPWSKNRLKELLEGLKIQDGPLVVTMDTLKTCEGEAVASNRKAKLIFLFEWDIIVKFTARIAGLEFEYKGEIMIPNLSDENEASEIEIEPTIETKGPHEAQIRQMLNKKGKRAIQRQMAIYIRELKEEFSKGLILPTELKPQVVTKENSSTSTSSSSVDKRAFQNTVIVEEKKGAGKLVVDVKEVSVSDTFQVTPDRLFDVLQQPNLVRAWANGNVKWDFVVGGSFSLFGGNVTGKFVQIEPQKRILMNWRLKNYPDDHHAQIELRLKDTGKSTIFEVNGAGVPVNLAEETQNGLDRYYVQSIARTFGFSNRF